MSSDPLHQTKMQVRTDEKYNSLIRSILTIQRVSPGAFALIDDRLPELFAVGTRAARVLRRCPPPPVAQAAQLGDCLGYIRSCPDVHADASRLIDVCKVYSI